MSLRTYNRHMNNSNLVDTPRNITPGVSSTTPRTAPSHSLELAVGV